MAISQSINIHIMIRTGKDKQLLILKQDVVSLVTGLET